MRILFVTPHAPHSPDRDGMTLIAFHLLRALTVRHDVHVLTTGTATEADALRSTFRVRATVIPACPASRVRQMVAAFRGTGWFLQRSASVEFVRTLRRLVAEHHADVAYVHSPFLLGLVPHIEGIPVVFGAIDSMVDWFLLVAGRTTSPFKRWYLRREAFAARRAEQTLASVAQTIVVAERDRAAILSRVPSARITTIPNGIDAEAFRPEESETTVPTALFCGTLSYPPNEDAVAWFARRVWPGVRKTLPDARFVVVGRGASAALRRLCGSDGSLSLVEDVPDIRPYLRDAFVSVAPLQVATGFQNKILEACAAGRAVVASPIAIDGLPEELQAVCVSATTERAWQEAIVRLWTDASARRLQETRARSVAERWTWDAVAKRYEQVFLYAHERTH